jgi:Zn finger protein HypA/HybF involved in hydrogenase expression
MKPHPSITETRILEACERHITSLDDPGFCLACGNEQGGCEPDARRYKCEACGEFQVYGAEELAMMIVVIDYHSKEEGE